jgi:threonine/homoserine/homoserine lactone efflux protein
MSGMTPELFGALAVFTFASSITPGPNNTMLMTSGVNFGLKASIPHMVGVSLGFTGLTLVVGLGLGGLFTAYPVLHVVLEWAGTLYLLYLAAKIALSDHLTAKKEGARPLRFSQAASFQVVNAKAWAMAVGALTAYAPAQNYFLNVFIVAVTFCIVGAPCIAAWTAFGVGMRRFLGRPGVLKAFNVTMAGVLVLSLVPTILDLLKPVLHGPSLAS